jgi:phosphomannomutase
MAPKFGTSGLRGLVTELTPALVADHLRAFFRVCDMGSGLFVGRDLRSSSPMLADVVVRTAADEGLAVTDCGALPTPALALAAMGAGAAAVMVTGSHIPDDRNGLKFYTPAGEIAKADELAILGALGGGKGPGGGVVRSGLQPADAYRARYLVAYGGALAGLRIGVWEQSSVARDLLGEVLEGCGARVIRLGRSEAFVPVDTEAVGPEWRAMFGAWVAEHGLDALVSTDGDADRPLVVDGAGRMVPGDVLGALTALALGAERVVTTVSANTGIDLTGRVAVDRVKIGSPFVIAGMAAAGNARVVGYEPNGGFLLGFAAAGPSGRLAPLMTRDCLLPMLAPLAAARAAGQTLAALVAGLPARFTATGRLQEVRMADVPGFLAGVAAEPAAMLAAAGLGALQGVDLTDGWRATDEGGEVLHLRPSGNAPEFRIYAEAATEARAGEIVARAVARVRAALGGQ